MADVAESLAVKESPTGLCRRWLVEGRDRICYLEAGAGPPVVFLHGGASDSRDWIPLMRYLSADYQVLAPDMLGFGQSSDSARPYRIEDFAAHIVGFMERKCEGPAVLVGHSLGGRVVIEVARRWPSAVRRVVLIDSAGFGDVAKFGLFIIRAADFLRQMRRRPRPYPDFDPEDVSKNMVCLEKLPAIGQPALLVWGLWDPYYPVSYARKAAALMPRARLKVFAGCRHAPHKEKPKAVAALLRGFLDGLKG